MPRVPGSVKVGLAEDIDPVSGSHKYRVQVLPPYSLKITPKSPTDTNENS